MKTELEVRLQFTDPEKALEVLQTKGNLVGEYETLDVYYQPRNTQWSFEEKNMRLRHSYSGVDQGKTIFMYRELLWAEGVKTHTVHWKYEVESLEIGERVLDTWGMEEIVRYKKRGMKFVIDTTEVFYEDIDHIGVLVEVEKDNQEELDRFIQSVFEGVSYTVIPQSVASVVQDALG